MPPSRGSQGGNKLKNLDFYDLLLKFREKGLADICDLIDDVKDARIGRLEAETSVQDASWRSRSPGACRKRSRSVR